MTLVAACDCDDGRRGPVGMEPEPDATMMTDDDASTTPPPSGEVMEVVTPGTPADTPMTFGDEEGTGSAPQLVYPENGSVVPPNMRELEFHYRTGGNSVFEMTFYTPSVELRVYFGCPEEVGGGCIYTPDESVWDTLAEAARNAGPITYRLRGANAGFVSSSISQEITFAEEDITGGLYYWNAGRGQIMRYEWGRRGSEAETYLDQGRTGGLLCVGCHAVSRDGTRIAVGVDLPGTIFQTYDVASRDSVFNRGGGTITINPQEPTFFSFSPDSSQIVGGAGTGLDIFNTESGEVAAARIVDNGTMPDWSPDGDHIVYVESATPPPFNTAAVSGGSIVTLDREGDAWTEGTRLVIRTTENNYYPAYSPDGAWVVFCRSPSNINSMGDDEDNMVARVTDAELWVVAADGSAPAMRLERTDGFSDSWAKWDPTPYVSGGRPLFWLSFASRRAYGLRLEEDQRSQLWMAAFRPDEARNALEPASPAIRVPFQDIGTANHLPQWVTSIERQTCTDDSECGGEFCLDGRCYGNLI